MREQEEVNNDDQQQQQQQTLANPLLPMPLNLSQGTLFPQPTALSQGSPNNQSSYPYMQYMYPQTNSNGNGQQQAFNPMFAFAPVMYTPTTIKEEDADKDRKDDLSSSSDTTTLANGQIPQLFLYPHFPLPINPLGITTPTTLTQNNSALSPAPPKAEPASGRGRGKKRTKESTPTSANKKRKTPVKRESSGSRTGKGLRLFSMKVCEQVQAKGTTTYNEVANELVKEFMEQSQTTKGHDEKNIRRRVYDALNVLMAVGIITKDKKDIKWQGLPIDYQQEVANLMDLKKQRLESLQTKGRQLTELIRQQRSLTQLYSRNTSAEFSSDQSPRINLPFIIVHTDNDTSIECEMDTPMTEVFFNFSMPFEIHDDNEILSRLGFDELDNQLLRAQSPQRLPETEQQTQYTTSSSSSEDVTTQPSASPLTVIGGEERSGGNNDGNQT